MYGGVFLQLLSRFFSLSLVLRSLIMIRLGVYPFGLSSLEFIEFKLLESVGLHPLSNSRSVQPLRQVLF